MRKISEICPVIIAKVSIFPVVNGMFLIFFSCRSSEFYILALSAEFPSPLNYYKLCCCLTSLKMSRSPDAKEDPVECPLCMEPLEIDDINFFPCTCGYQICRFCWHRIRTDENGLCPACRKVSASKQLYFTIWIFTVQY